jgi:hypothetical protein
MDHLAEGMEEAVGERWRGLKRFEKDVDAECLSRRCWLDAMWLEGSKTDLASSVYPVLIPSPRETSTKQIFLVVRPFELPGKTPEGDSKLGRKSLTPRSFPDRCPV